MIIKKWLCYINDLFLSLSSSGQRPGDPGQGHNFMDSQKLKISENDRLFYLSYHVFMQKSLKKFLIIFLVFITTTGLLLAAGPKIKTNKKKLSGIEKNIQDKEKKIKRSKQKEKRIKKDLNYINHKLSKTKNKINKLKKEIDEHKEEYKKQERELKIEEKRAEFLKNIIAKELRLLYKYSFIKEDPVSHIINILFKDASFTAKDRKNYEFKRLLSYNDMRYKKALDKQEDIIRLQNDTLINKKNLENTKNKNIKKNKDLNKEKNNRKTLLSREKSKQRKYKKEVIDLRNTAQELQDFIDNLIRQEKIKKAKRGNGSRYYDVISTKGSLPWPVSGKIITKYGKHKHPKLDTYHISNGVEIKANKDSLVRAVDQGKIAFAGLFSSYGNTVIIDHSEGIYTVYSYLDNLKVKKDQKILKNDILGNIGYSNFSKVYALYFEVRIDGTPMDPMLWLRVIKN